MQRTALRLGPPGAGPWGESFFWHGRGLRLCLNRFKRYADPVEPPGAAPWPQDRLQRGMIAHRRWLWSCSLAVLVVVISNSAGADAVKAAGRSCTAGLRSRGQALLRIHGGGEDADLASAVERSATGVIGADEAVNLRDMGFLRGPWQAESEIEPESDVQDAHEAQWPEDWAGEEEAGDIMRLTSGPVRLYASNKYNHDILPTGRVKPQTMKRLAEQLEDDEAFQSVSVENGDEYSSQVPRDGADGSEREERSGGGLARESRVSVMGGIGRAREAESYEDGGDETDIVASLSSKPNEVINLTSI